MFDELYKELAKKFYLVKVDEYVVVDEREYKKRLINGKIDSIQRKIFESKCFNDKNFIDRMVELHCSFFKFIPEEYKNNNNYVNHLIDINPNIYKYIKQKDDTKIMKKVLKQNPFLLKYVPDKYKDMEEYVLLTSNKEDKVVCFASNRLKEKYGFYSSISLLDPKFIGSRIY